MKWIRIFTFLFLFSCNIYSSVIIHNNTNNSISCRILKNDKNDKTIEFDIDKEESRKYLFRSKNIWTNNKTNEYIETIKRIEIVKENDTLIISGKNEIVCFFNSMKIKRNKRELIINIDENLFHK